jgi:D-glycero-D-manno-heptose 1,7-bisphosphate phosphatase
MPTPLQRAVFLDRDGVINRAIIVDEKPYPPHSLKEFEILPGVRAAVFALKLAGFRVIVVTNQPDVATGKQSRDVVEEFHRYLSAFLPLDDIYTCYHTDQDRCECRKPLPGMLVAASRKWGIQLSKSYLVGDRWRDILAGQSVGCQTFWVREIRYAEPEPINPTWTVGSLQEASKIICSLVHDNREVA